MASRRLSRMLPWNASAACGPETPPITTELYESGPLGGLSGCSTVSEDVPSLVELGWRSGVNSMRRLRQFRGSGPLCLGGRGGAGR